MLSKHIWVNLLESNESKLFATVPLLNSSWRHTSVRFISSPQWLLGDAFLPHRWLQPTWTQVDGWRITQHGRWAGNSGKTSHNRLSYSRNALLRDTGMEWIASNILAAFSGTSFTFLGAPGRHFLNCKSRQTTVCLLWESLSIFKDTPTRYIGSDYTPLRYNAHLRSK